MELVSMNPFGCQLVSTDVSTVVSTDVSWSTVVVNSDLNVGLYDAPKRTDLGDNGNLFLGFVWQSVTPCCDP